jgi:hypothetical protein
VPWPAQEQQELIEKVGGKQQQQQHEDAQQQQQQQQHERVAHKHIWTSGLLNIAPLVRNNCRGTAPL